MEPVVKSLDKKVPKYRRPINDHQLAILNTLYKFRFLTISLLTKNQQASNQRVIAERLKRLTVQGYIAMNYDSSYKIKGKPATYYLTAKGVRYLRDKPYTNESALRSIYQDRRASESQIQHRLNVFKVYIDTKYQYLGRFKFFSNTELINKPYIPKLRPDSYLIDTHTNKSYFLDCLEEGMDYWTLRKRVKRFVAFAESENWQSYKAEPFPDVLLVCESDSLAYKVRRLTEKELDSSYVDFRFRVRGSISSMF